VGKRVSDRQFADSKHRYTDPRTGERLISVTSITGCFDPDGQKASRMAGAAVKIEREGGNYREIWGAKTNTGSRVHDYAHRWMEGEWADVTDEDQPYVDAFTKFCNEYEPEWIEAERAVVSSLGYGGRFDGIGYFDDAFVLADYKTGRKYPTQLTLQLTGYKNADGMIVYDEDGWAVDLDPMPHIDRCAGLYLHGDGTYELTYCDVNDASWAAFQALLRAKQWATGVAQQLKATAAVSEDN
jgi:hypothetical protein